MHCKLSNPLVNSHHNILISSVRIPLATSANEHNADRNIVAPRVENSRTKIIWSDSGVEDYKNIIVSSLKHIQDLWLQSPQHLLSR